MAKSTPFLVVLLVLVSLPPPAPAQAASYRTETVTIESWDGTPLKATLWIPNEPGRHPAVLLAHGWGSNRTEMIPYAERYAAKGWFALAWDARGFGESGGIITLNGPNEVRDVRHLISYLANRSEVLLDAPHDPRVGMRGASYGGAIQLLTAREDPRLDVLVPLYTWYNLTRSLIPGGVLKEGWVTGLFLTGEAAGYGVTGQNPNQESLDPQLREYFTRFLATNEAPPELLTYLVDRSLDPPGMERWRTRNPLAQVYKSPTLFVQGFPDTLFDTREAFESFATWTWRFWGNVSYRAPDKLVLTTGGHGYNGAMPESEKQEMEARIDSWLGFWLEGGGDPILNFARPLEWWDVPQGVFAWTPYPTQSVAYYFQLDPDGRTGRLDQKPPQDASSVPMAAGGLTSFSEIPYFQGQAPIEPPASDAPVTSFAYTTNPFKEATTIRGAPSLWIRLGTTSSDLSLFLKLYDVAPDGTASLIDRQVSAARLKQTNPSLDQPVNVTFSLPWYVHRFEAGHALRVVVATSDLAYAANRVAGVVKLVHDPAVASRIDLDFPVNATHASAPPTLQRVERVSHLLVLLPSSNTRIAATFLIMNVTGRPIASAGDGLTIRIPDGAAAGTPYKILLVDVQGQTGLYEGVLPPWPPPSSSSWWGTGWGLFGLGKGVVLAGFIFAGGALAALFIWVRRRRKTTDTLIPDHP